MQLVGQILILKDRKNDARVNLQLLSSRALAEWDAMCRGSSEESKRAFMGLFPFLVARYL